MNEINEYILKTIKQCEGGGIPKAVQCMVSDMFEEGAI